MRVVTDELTAYGSSAEVTLEMGDDSGNATETSLTIGLSDQPAKIELFSASGSLEVGGIPEFKISVFGNFERELLRRCLLWAARELESTHHDIRGGF